MIKLFGGAIVVFICFCMGCRRAENINTTYKKALSMINGLAYINVQISTFSIPLCDIFTGLMVIEPSLEGFCNSCRTGIDKGEALFSEIWKNAVYSYTENIDMRKILAPLGNMLGSSIAEEESCAVENALIELKALSECYISDYKEKRKLYSRIGLLCGMFIVILLI